MSRYTGPSWRVSRRLGVSLSGTGKELARRAYAPGDHGRDRRGKLSEYGTQLREKQKLRFMYGMTERQFSNLFVRAGKIKEGTHGANFMALLERRLDNMVYRLVKVGQIIAVRDKSKNLDIIKNAVEAVVSRPSYVDFDADKLEGKLNRIPAREDMNADIDEALIVEFYNK